jgi:cation-transporting ATPase 13A1
VGVVCNAATAGAASSAAAPSTAPARVGVHEASLEAALVLAACHALVELPADGSVDAATGQPTPATVIGDPIELAALKGVEWRYDAATQRCQPGDFAGFAKAIASLKVELQALAAGDPQHRRCAARVQELETRLAAAQERAAANPVASCTIAQRHHFSSDLQRMSVTCDVAFKAATSGGGGGGGSPQRYCLVKGSPEALAPLLAEGAMPAWYWQSYNALAEEGMRVLALAYKTTAPTEASTESRAAVESGLSFAGFIAFTCKTRADSPTVVSALLESGHQVWCEECVALPWGRCLPPPPCIAHSSPTLLSLFFV